MSLLTLKNVSVHYGNIQAVHHINLHVEDGETLCLIGANGAGKSTTLKSIVGLLRLSSGEIMFDGKNIKTIAPHERIKHGLTLVPEGRGVFPHMSVEENLLMGAYYRQDNHIHPDLEKYYHLFPKLLDRRTQLAGTLSGGEQQMVAMARALMSRPRLLLLDEPSMGLAPIVVQTIFNVIKQVAAEGVSILLVEQNAKAALSLSRRGYVMEHGEITLQDNAQDLLHNPAVQAAYLGG